MARLKYLLDTHAFLWFMEGSDRLSQRARSEIEARDDDHASGSSTTLGWVTPKSERHRGGA